MRAKAATATAVRTWTRVASELTSNSEGVRWPGAAAGGAVT
jgi:hypothetical protein